MKIFEELVNLEVNNCLKFGQARRGVKTIIFDEKDFKEELKPNNAKIKRQVINNEMKICMTYQV